MIFFLRGEKVMLDRDLALLYGVETRALNQAVRRNLERFPDDFLFTLTRSEIRNISQTVICSDDFKHARNAYAFTEQGVAMLSSVLRSRAAVAVNIEIMRAFARLRRLIASHAALSVKLIELEKKYDAQFKVVFDAIRELMKDPVKPKREIGFHTLLKKKEPKRSSKR